MQFKVFRYDPDKDAKPYMQEYDVTLEATPFHLTSGNQPDDISVFSAIQALGLRLESARVAMPVLVVQAVSPPTDN